MAKELPYFKFEPNQWENGNIQMFSREEKGLFVDLCSMYWSRLGDLPFKLAVQKLCAGNALALQSLCDEKIFTVIDGLICIDFLNEQLQEFDNIGKQNSKNAREGWEKRRKIKVSSERNASASIPQCENDAIREEEIREDKSKEEEIQAAPFDFKKSLLSLGIDPNTVSQWLKVRKSKKAVNTEIAFKGIQREILASGRSPDECITIAIERSWTSFKAEWLNNIQTKGNGTTTQPPKRTLEDQTRSVIERIHGKGAYEIATGQHGHAERGNNEVA